MHATALCKFLPWDTDFFGQRIARVIPERLDAEALLAVLAWCRAERIDCLYFLADPDDAETLRQVARPAFKLVDLRMTLVHTLKDAPDSVSGGAHLRDWQEDDIPQLRAIASASYTDSRFYFDGGFSRERCDALYAVWIETSCRGGADRVLVAEVAGEAAAFVTLHFNDRAAEIGLVGVAEAARGQGLGKQIVQHALAQCQAHGCQLVSVVTQGRNIHAQRLYQRCGFVTESIKVWYHGWGLGVGE